MLRLGSLVSFVSTFQPAVASAFDFHFQNFHSYLPKVPLRARERERERYTNCNDAHAQPLAQDTKDWPLNRIALEFVFLFLSLFPLSPELGNKGVIFVCLLCLIGAIGSSQDACGIWLLLPTPCQHCHATPQLSIRHWMPSVASQNPITSGLLPAAWPSHGQLARPTERASNIVIRISLKLAGTRCHNAAWITPCGGSFSLSSAYRSACTFCTLSRCCNKRRFRLFLILSSCCNKRIMHKSRHYILIYVLKDFLGAA